MMCFLVHAPQNRDNIAASLGLADYSYYFVMQRFIPVLQRLGVVIEIVNPESEVDRLHDFLSRFGFDVVYLSFTPPNKTAIGLRCPTIPVFAWEYSTIPTESWGGDARHDWRFVLRQVRAAITHSCFAQQATRRAMGDAYPVTSLPAPVWDFYAATSHRVTTDDWVLSFSGIVLDSHELGFRDAFDVADPVIEKNVQRLVLRGVVYAAVFNPNDGRKNWHDTLWAFCWAHRDNWNATLLIKLVHHDAVFACAILLHEMKKLAPFKCRVVVIHGFLDDETYRHMTRGVTYIVNSAYGEGQCLPLMEFMSAGKPALAPNHSAMADYVNEGNSFVVRSAEEWTHWPHDPRLLLRAFRYRLEWESLFDAFVESYRVAVSDPDRYEAMSAAATEALRVHCSRAQIEAGLRQFLQQLGYSLSSCPPGWLVRLIGGSRRVISRLAAVTHTAAAASVAVDALMEEHEQDNE